MPRLSAPCSVYSCCFLVVARRTGADLLEHVFQPMGQFAFRLSGRFGQGAGHQFLADTNAEPSGDQLVEHQPFSGLEPVPRVQNGGFAIFIIHGGQGFQKDDPIG